MINFPDHFQGSIEEWLRLLRLDEYIAPLLAQGYETVRDVTQLPWEDMEDIGIFKLGHQKKLLLAIKRVNDILSGKWQPNLLNAQGLQVSKRNIPKISLGKRGLYTRDTKFSIFLQK